MGRASIRLTGNRYDRIAEGDAADRRPARQSVGSDNLSAIVAAVRAFPAAVAEIGRSEKNVSNFFTLAILWSN